MLWEWIPSGHFLCCQKAVLAWSWMLTCSSLHFSVWENSLSSTVMPFALKILLKYLCFVQCDDDIKKVRFGLNSVQNVNVDWFLLEVFGHFSNFMVTSYHMLFSFWDQWQNLANPLYRSPVILLSVWELFLNQYKKNCHTFSAFSSGFAVVGPPKSCHGCLPFRKSFMPYENTSLCDQNLVETASYNLQYSVAAMFNLTRDFRLRHLTKTLHVYGIKAQSTFISRDVIVTIDRAWIGN
jgi:hypothetical protein